MTCLVCGSENKPANRFCGACGGALIESQLLTCSSCGNINEPNYKFCGKCGTKIDLQKSPTHSAADVSGSERLSVVTPISSEQENSSKVAEKGKAIASDAVPSELKRAESLNGAHNGPVNAVPIPKQKAIPTAIGGPSFLGLNDDPENGEYLLEEDEGGSGGGGLRVLLVILLLAGIAGAVLLQIRSKRAANPKSPELAASVPLSREESQMPSTQNDTQKDTNSGSATNSTDGSQSPGPDQSEAANSETAKEEDAVKAASARKTPVDVPATEKNSTDSKPADVKKDDKAAGLDIAEKSVSKNVALKEKPSEEPRRPSEALVTAQRYLQGRGVRQNCAQGLQYLKTATNQNDPQAAVQMGALYASGHCVRQDRVQAYRWFASASDLQPSNRWIEKNLNLLWADMTAAERRQISR